MYSWRVGIAGYVLVGGVGITGYVLVGDRDNRVCTRGR